MARTDFWHPIVYAADSKNIQDTWLEDVKVGEHVAFFGVSGSGWSNDGSRQG